MELTNEIKQNIITAIKENRENYPSDNKHAAAPVSYTHLTLPTNYSV